MCYYLQTVLILAVIYVFINYDWQVAKQCNNTLNLRVLCSHPLPHDTTTSCDDDEVQQVTADVSNLSVTTTSKQATVKTEEKVEEERAVKMTDSEKMPKTHNAVKVPNKKKLFYLKNEHSNLVIDIKGRW